MREILRLEVRRTHRTTEEVGSGFKVSLHVFNATRIDKFFNFEVFLVFRLVNDLPAHKKKQEVEVA